MQGSGYFAFLDARPADPETSDTYKPLLTLLQSSNLNPQGSASFGENFNPSFLITSRG